MEEIIKVRQLFATSKTGIYAPYGKEYTISAISIFAIEYSIIQKSGYPQKLKILAINAGEEQYIDLIYMPEHFYRAEVPNIGIFYFVVDTQSKVSMRLDNNEIARLSTLTPVNEEFFEQACRDYHFFFVGESTE